ncbi:TPA: DUF262 domain-containing protein [Stenotrophomonas maltophilia]|uniref:DUF262 domain-containing protein n=1 Tax=Stenotrophomonas maltophilia TaxID=40324 RepID=UPI002557B37E|nr:DUF262 domain-containing protein [Stenotrophomonas maltophilia]
MSWIDVKTHAPRPLTWWLNEFRRDRIEMQPGYQRRSNLWSKWKKAHLIDSIINGFDVPKFYVADFNKAEGRLQDSDKPYAVIDGKQRFEALFSFLSGEFSLNPSAVYHAESEVLIAGLDIFELRERHSHIAKRLELFEPVVMSVATNSQALIDELFVRLNSGVSINGAERRNAMPGPLPQIIRDITVHPFFVDRVRFSKDRMQEFNLAAKLLMFEYGDEFMDTKAKNLDAFVMAAASETASAFAAYENAHGSRSTGWRAKLKAAEDELERALAPYRDAEQRVMENLDSMAAVFESRDRLLAKQGVIPVYYWLLRNRPKMRSKFREFLEYFDPAVLDHVRIAREDSDAADPRILAYYNAIRTSNDRSSMDQRYSMLIDFFTQWRRGELDLTV